MTIPEDVLRKAKRTNDEEIALINAYADELNAEAEDVLQYQADDDLFGGDECPQV
jgi:hypothetical protein